MTHYETALHRATEVLGNETVAEEWLDKMSNSLGSPPRKLLSSQEGLDQVLRHLRSVELALHRE